MCGGIPLLTLCLVFQRVGGGFAFPWDSHFHFPSPAQCRGPSSLPATGRVDLCLIKLLEYSDNFEIQPLGASGHSCFTLVCFTLPHPNWLHPFPRSSWDPGSSLGPSFSYHIREPGFFLAHPFFSLKTQSKAQERCQGFGEASWVHLLSWHLPQMGFFRTSPCTPCSFYFPELLQCGCDGS